MQEPNKTNQLEPQTQACLNLIHEIKHNIKGENISAISVLFSPGADNHPYSMASLGSNSLAESALPTGPDTKFPIASITKSFVAVLILHLFTAQNISLDTPLENILSQFTDTPWGSPTIRQLLNMTSGIPDYLAGPYYLWPAFQQKLNQVWTPTDIVNAYIQQFGYPTNFQPGQGWYYSNLGYIILSQVVEKLSGKPIEDNLNGLAQKYNLDMVYKPEVIVNDKNTNFVAQFAQYYFDNTNYAPYMNQSFFSGAGGFIATIPGFCKWAKMLLYSNEVLTPHQKTQLQSLVSYNNGQPMSKPSPQDPLGYGLGVANTYLPGYGPSWWYQGNLYGATAFYFLVPTTNFGGMVIIAFAANTFNSNVPSDTALKILNAIGAQPIANFVTESDKHLAPIKSSHPVQVSARVANTDYVLQGQKSPYNEIASAWEIALEEDTHFIRLFNDPAHLIGKWMVRAEDIKELSPLQIQEKFALPYLPTYMTDVCVPAGTKVRYGSAASLYDWGHGGGTQYELLEEIPSAAFNNVRNLKVKTQENSSSNGYSLTFFRGANFDPNRSRELTPQIKHPQISMR